MNDRLAGPRHFARPQRSNPHVRAAHIAVLAALACSPLAAQEKQPKQPATPGGVIGTQPGGLLQKLVAPDGVAGDMFGAAVASSRSIVVAGAPNHPANPPSNGDYFAGAAYVFVRESGGTWEPAQKLVAPSGDANPFDAYGSAVSIDGSLLAIGAPQDDGSVPRSNRGAVYVYAGAGGEWNFEMKLTPPVSDPAQTFGQAIALVGDTLAIGAGAPNTDGKVYVFKRSGTTWSIESTLSPTNEALFGWSVALHQTTLIVGAPGAASGGVPQSGRAFVYERGPAGWSLLQTLNNPTPNLFDQFGWSVAVHGRIVAAGTPFDTVNGIATTGATYMFSKSGGAYAPMQTLTSLPALANQHFGNAVAMANGRLLVGAEIAQAEEGRAYRFSQLNPQSWTQVATYKDADPSDQPWFGCAVALADFVVVGARRDDEVAIDAGAAFVFATGP